MKRLSMMMLLIAAFAATTPACKKGEEDPGLTFKSRAGRLAGDWNVTSYEQKDVVEISNPSTTTTLTYTHDGSEVKIKKVFESGATVTTTGDTGDVTHTFSFDKEGTYTIKYNRSYIHEQSATNSINRYDTTITEEGTWQFVGKSGDYKNKERIALTPTKQVEEIEFGVTFSGKPEEVSVKTASRKFSGLESARIYSLIELSSKEIKMTLENDASEVNTSTSSGGTTVTNNSASVSSSQTMTLTAVE